MTSLKIQPAPVRKTLSVKATPERAFEVFTAGFDRWWPRSHHIGGVDMARAVLEPRAGGRWYEVGVDGAECDWGEVLVWDPPQRLILAWRIGADWKYDPSLRTEVELRFTREAGGATRVDFEHRLLENMGEAGAAVREAIDSPGGWSGILAMFAATAEAA